MLDAQERRNQGVRDYYQRKLRSGLCMKCDRVIDKSRSRSRCSVCLDKANEYHRSRIDRYNESRRRLRAERHEAGLCIQCGKPKFVNTKLQRSFACRKAASKLAA